LGLSSLRINIVGTSGCGKSTVAERLARKLGVPYIEMDELFWGPNWSEPGDEAFFPKVEQALSGESWVLAGNYSRTRHIKWRRAQLVVWLDLPFYIVFYRIIRRSLIRGFKKERLWAGNTESIWKHLFTRDSMILWTIKTFRKNRQRYTTQFSQELEALGIRCVRLRSRKEVEEFIEVL